ncbi:MAG: hypothetical protein WAM14_12780 [Candidatus Nitrosopolaris sp.]
MKETVDDIDFVVASNDFEKVMDYCVSMPEIDEVLGKGPTKTFVRLNNRMDADLRVVPEESFGSALQYFTGSKEHDVAIHKISLAKGFHLNEWGIFDDSQNKIAGSTEEEVYQTLDLEWIHPEMRENLEVELAKKGGNGLPKLIEYNDLKGDLQVHSNSTDVGMSIEEMAASEKFGLQYIVITDHTKSLKLTNGLDEKQLLDQANKIAEVNDRIRRLPNKKERQHKDEGDSSGTASPTKDNNFRILSGAEVNIMRWITGYRK